MARLDVRRLEGDVFHAWDARAAGSARDCLHSSDWLVKNASLQDQDLILLGCYDSEELIGVVPSSCHALTTFSGWLSQPRP